MPLSGEEIINLISNTIRRPVSLNELASVISVRGRDKRLLKETVNELLADGRLIKTRRNLLGLPDKLNLIKGIVSSHKDGYAFVIPEDGQPDIYIPPRNAREAMHGDKVMVRVEHARRGGRKEGRVIRVVERGVKMVVGTLQMVKNSRFVVPAEQKISHEIFIPKGKAGAAKSGQVVVAEITTYPDSQRGAEGIIVQVLGFPDDPDVEVMSIVHKYGISSTFPPDVLSAAGKVSEHLQPEEIAKRKDLRGMNIVTIDGETAKDFDDAVTVRRDGKENIRLWVSIADVSFYVKEGSPLDREAFSRGTSTYFPDRAIPMLPEELSNGICSLKPREDRLTITAEMLFDKEGRMLESSFYPSVIRSAERLTYTIVKKIIEDKDKELSEKYSHIYDDLILMKELCLRLHKMRLRRGSIDFDLPEPQIILNIDGKTEDIVRAERNIAHQIIEECMLAANEAVAARITDHDLPFIYRVHETPDDTEIAEFREFTHNLGYDLTTKKAKEEKKPAFQELLEKIKGRPEERLINTVLLRSMKQARYSEVNVGHFGLAAKCYTHFTSPIRRYPDLIVHRILRESLLEKMTDENKAHSSNRFQEERRNYWIKQLPIIATQSSRMERISMEAEREIIDLKKCQFMLGRVGDVFDGIISGVISFGFFVELCDFLVEGLVHVSSLKDDYYHLIEKQHVLIGENSKRRFRIGDKIKVRIDDVNIERRQINFSLPEEIMPGKKRRQ